jgi:hypothetical protein
MLDPKFQPPAPPTPLVQTPATFDDELDCWPDFRITAESGN